MSVKVTKDRTRELMAAIDALVKDRVLIGIPAGNAVREPDADDPKPEINNAEIGYLNEFGMPEINLPARPHLIPGVKAALPKIEAKYRKAATVALDGKAGEVKKAHEQVGIIARNAVQQKISDGPFVPLAERTLAARRKRGVTRTKPLIDKGEYRRNINYVVRPAKDVKVKK